MERNYSQSSFHLEEHFKDPFSALSHLIFAGFSLIGAIPLLILAKKSTNSLSVVSMLFFILGLLLLYTASGIYHTFDISDKINTKLQKFDHMMIYVLIAGSYSPICLLVLPEKSGKTLFIVIWSLALLGILQALLFIHAPKWLNSILYIAMGWSCLFSIAQIKSLMTGSQFFWLTLGGVVYTVGGIIYALKLPFFQKMQKHFSLHDLFHCFCIGGSICHYILMIKLLS